MRLRGFAVAGGLFAVSAAFAGPTALIAMPIADILGHREFIFQITSTGNERNIDKAVHWGQSITVGMFDVMEIGIDNDFLGNTVLNAKAQLYQSPGAGKFALSAGLQNIGLLGAQPDKYVVGRYDMKALRLHAGCLYNDRFRAMLGVDAPLPKGMTLMADYISGPNSYVWSQIMIPLPVKGFQLGLAGGVPIQHGTGMMHQISLLYDRKF
jgi:hypothetical protein